ncbi:potassium channel family protein [Alpinimonas psychrophila]|uniref:Trk system potassium uptake protein TrkA n=1 Tax=Alpinimonas psychrophila TaxID=748908 RepID=A0A7W3JUK0_9MICO|nr:TrkA family potassium uptake protein [Alpinimonas psychrophila]MBA8829528.1 trk system potassium uptake protein TrkA [Alpinimonas psychrophila]
MVDRKKKNTAVLVIGLGRFGAATAGQLDRLDREVLAVDENMELVQKWSERITHAVQADVTKIEALEQIGARDFRTAVVAVGSSIEASVLITANLVDLGVEQIWAKAISKSHGKILERIGANHVIYPEAEAGERVAHLLSGQLLDFVEIDPDFAIVKLHPPRVLAGKTLTESGVRGTSKVTVVGVKKPGESFTFATAETLIDSGDEILVSGHPSDIERFAALPK